MTYTEELDPLWVRPLLTITLTNFRMPLGKRTRKSLLSEDNKEKLLMKRTVTELKEEPDFVSCVTGVRSMKTNTHKYIRKMNIWFILLIKAS